MKRPMMPRIRVLRRLDTEGNGSSLKVFPSGRHARRLSRKISPGSHGYFRTFFSKICVGDRGMKRKVSARRSFGRQLSAVRTEDFSSGWGLSFCGLGIQHASAGPAPRFRESSCSPTAPRPPQRGTPTIPGAHRQRRRAGGHDVRRRIAQTRQPHHQSGTQPALSQSKPPQPDTHQNGQSRQERPTSTLNVTDRSIAAQPPDRGEKSKQQQILGYRK